MEENEAKSVKAIEHEEVTFQDPFNIAGLHTTTKSTNTRTAALPPQFSGFQ
jgi:chaperone required for assembly of F1-ATPase